MAPSDRNPIPTRLDLDTDDWKMDKYRGRRKCPVHLQQEMIPIGIIDMCPMVHGNSPSKDK